MMQFQILTRPAAELCPPIPERNRGPSLIHPYRWFRPKIQDGVPVIADVVREKVKFT